MTAKALLAANAGFDGDAFIYVAGAYLVSEIINRFGVRMVAYQRVLSRPPMALTRRRSEIGPGDCHPLTVRRMQPASP